MSRVLQVAFAVLMGGVIAEALPKFPVIVIREHAIIAESILTNGIVESNETITCAITLANAGELNATNVSAILVSGNGITPVVGQQNFGDLSTNGNTVTREFTFTVNRPAGRPVQGKLLVQSSAGLLGDVVFDLPVGDNVFTYRRLVTMRVPADRQSTVGPAEEYPSVIHVSGLEGAVGAVRVTLHNYAHEFAEDMNAMLVAPGGQAIMLMSDCGGAYDVTNANLTFDSMITNALTTQGEIVTGTYSAVDHNAGSVMAWPAPAASILYLSQLRRQDPNGDWRFYLYDEDPEDIGALRGGWSLTISVLQPPILSVIDNGDGRLRITANRLDYRSFLIDYSTNGSDWEVYGQLPPNPDTAAFLDAPMGQQRFYRLRRNSP